MTDFIAAVVLLAVIAAAARYVYKERKRGVRCVGCPDAGSCCMHRQQSLNSDLTCGSEESACCCCHTDEN